MPSRPVPLSSYYCSLFVILVSTTLLAQSNPVPLINQPGVPPNLSADRILQRRMPQQTLFVQRRNTGFKSAARLRRADPPSGLNFATAVAYGSGGEDALSVAVADVNGDGKPDLVVANLCGSSGNCSNGTVGVLLGNDDGTFQTAVPYGSGGFEAESVAVGDVNGDGKLDLVVANQCVSQSDCDSGTELGTVGVLLGNGDGTFQTAVTYGSDGVGTISVAVGDVNGDGKADLVVANTCASSSDCTNGTVAVLLGNGDGTFQTAVTYGSGGLQATSVAVADVNGDGKPDLLVTNSCVSDNNCANGTVGVLLGNGDGTFQTAVPYGSGPIFAFKMTVADVSGDGKPDLLVANECADSSCSTNGTVGVLLGNGDGTFQTAVTYGSGGFLATSVAVADVNEDGKSDLLVSNLCADSSCLTNGTVGVLFGNGDGTFHTAVTYDSGGGGASSAAVGDVNGDGKPDVLVANECADSSCSTNGTVGVLINTPAPMDPTPPVITVSANPTTLWPPNAKMVPVTISGAITDTGSGVNAGTAAYAVVDEYGQVQPSGSIAVGAGGSYSFPALLQASRAGSDKDGRQYTVSVSAKDNAGNVGSASTVVTVPHDLGSARRKPALQINSR